MRDVRLLTLAGSQFNRISRDQLLELGFSDGAIVRRVASGQFVAVEMGVYAIAPVLEHDDWGRWKGATLTAPETFLSTTSAAAARGFWALPREFETVTRPGSGGPRQLGRVRVYRSSTLAGDCEEFHGIPITTVERILLDLARIVSARALARAVRDAIRLELTTTVRIGDMLGRHQRQRGSRRLADTLARYAGLPLQDARSGAEVRALEILRDAGRSMPVLNKRIAGEEADLSWASARRIVEIDGGPFHLDVGEDERKERCWKAAGWEVLRIDADDVYEHPGRLLRIAPEPQR